ncbi:MAG: aminopeptidase P family protein [Rikenellaceae bacterium]
MFNAQTYSDRRNTLRQTIKSGLIIILGNQESPANYPSNCFHFRQDSTFLYYFGLQNPDFAGVIDVDNNTECIYGNDVTLDDIIWMGTQPAVSELAAQVGVRSSYQLSELQREINIAIRKGRKIHFLPPYRAESCAFLSNLLGIGINKIKDYASKELIAAVVAQREIKSQEEIEQIEDACHTAYLMHTTAMQMAREGIYEREIAGAIEGIALSRGAGVSFRSIVTVNGQTLHNHYYGNKLTNDRMLLVDAGAETPMNYCSDYTRTFPVSGRFTDRQKAIYDIALASYDHTFNISREGITYREVHIEALKVLASGLKDVGLIKGDPTEAAMAGAVALFMPHGLGHQMGLDVHDMENLGEKLVGYDAKTERSTQFGLSALRMGKTLKQGHVLTVEPGIYFIPDLISKWKAEKINSAFIDYNKVEEYLDFGGIRIENDMLITEQGNRIMGADHTPVTTAEIEAEMAK